MDNNCCRSRDAIYLTFQEYMFYLFYNWSEFDDINIKPMKELVIMTADLLRDSEISDFDAEHICDAFLYVFKERLEKLIEINAQSDKYKKQIVKAQEIIEALAHGSVINKYRDLLKAKEVDGKIYVYPIYLTERPGYELNEKYGCSVKGAELLETKTGKIEEFDGLLRDNR